MCSDRHFANIQKCPRKWASTMLEIWASTMLEICYRNEFYYDCGHLELFNRGIFIGNLLFDFATFKISNSVNKLVKQAFRNILLEFGTYFQRFLNI